MARGVSIRSLRQLRELGEEVVQAAKSAMAQSAAQVVEDAKSRCPVKTGALRDSIKAQKQQGGAAYKITSLYYGRCVELSPKINKPFLFPAIDQNRDRIRDNIQAAIRQALRRL